MEKKYHICFLLLNCLLFSTTFGQEYSFEILGKVKDKYIRKVEILFVPIGSDFSVEQKVVSVIKKHFSFKGSLSYPYAVYFRYNDSVRSKLFFLDSGKQLVTVKTMNGKPIARNIHDIEYSNYLSKKLDKQQHKINNLVNAFNVSKAKDWSRQDSSFFKKSLNTLIEEKHFILKEYLSKNSSSFAALWLLFFELRKNLFTTNIAEAFQSNNFQSEIGLLQKITETITSKAEISVGNKIPISTFFNEEKRKFDLLSMNSEKYLLEFWFSNCGPCIKQFPDLKRISQQFDPSYFSIIGISTDTDIDLWKKAVLNYELPWVNLIDLDKNVYDVFKIFSFPTNILIDKNGEILKVNIGLIELEKYLKEGYLAD